MKRNKIMSVFLAVVLLAGIFLSMIFIIESAHHDCTGDDCPICIEIEQAAQFISNIKFIPILSVVLAVLSVITLIGVGSKTVCPRINTLISLKVEMLN